MGIGGSTPDPSGGFGSDPSIIMRVQGRVWVYGPFQTVWSWRSGLAFATDATVEFCSVLFQVHGRLL